MTDVETKPRLYDKHACSAFVNGVKSARWFNDQMRAGFIKAWQIGQTWCTDEETLLQLLADSFSPAVNAGSSRPAR